MMWYRISYPSSIPPASLRDGFSHVRKIVELFRAYAEVITGANVGTESLRNYLFSLNGGVFCSQHKCEELQKIRRSSQLVCLLISWERI